MAKDNEPSGKQSVFNLFPSRNSEDHTQRTNLEEEVKNPLERQIPDSYEEWHQGNSLRVFNNAFERSRMPRQPHWSVAWSDLMMTMFILFAILYLFQVNQQKNMSAEAEPGSGPDINTPSGVMETWNDPFKKKNQSTESAPGQLTRIYDLSRRTLEKEDLQNFASVDLADDKTVRIILTADLLFDSGKAELKATALDSLEKIAPLVSQTPYMINVAGHTDDRPIYSRSFPSNWELSLARAGKVARYLIGRTSLSKERFYITGHASNQPLKPNISSENRAANRRVEIILVRQNPRNKTKGDANGK